MARPNVGFHLLLKRLLFKEVTRTTGVQLDPNLLTLGFARRATAYKRADLLFSDLERLRSIARNVGPFQLVYAGRRIPKTKRVRNRFVRCSRLWQP
jgi:starch phosphorylase